MYSLVSIIFRMGFGLSLALCLGYGGILCSLLILDYVLYTMPDLVLSQWVVRASWFSTLGILSGVGSYIAWTDLDKISKFDPILIVSVTIMGLVGSWAGLYYSLNINAGSSYPYHPVSGAALFTSAFAANGISLSIVLLRKIRE